MAAYENELDRNECWFINSLRVKRVNNNDKRILNCAWLYLLRVTLYKNIVD